MWPILLNECLNLIISDLQKYSTQRKLPSSIPKRHRESATPSGVTDSPYIFPCGLCPPPGHNLVQAIPYPLREPTAFLPCTWADSDIDASFLEKGCNLRLCTLTHSNLFDISPGKIVTPTCIRWCISAYTMLSSSTCVRG